MKRWYSIPPVQTRNDEAVVGTPGVLCTERRQHVLLGREIEPALRQDEPIPLFCTHSDLTVMDIMCTGEEINSYIKRITSLI